MFTASIENTRQTATFVAGNIKKHQKTFGNNQQLFKET